MKRIKPLAQVYEAYTPEDFNVWSILFERQSALLLRNASARYLQALNQIGFNGAEIPDFRKANERLLQLHERSAWSIQVVPEIVPEKDFFDLLSRRIFPATCWLRTQEELDYIEEPDMFHDVFGHIPLLVDAKYAAFLEGFGKLALKWHTDPDAIQLLSRIYWYTIEFGLLRENDKVVIYGAGILSSVGETKHYLSSAPVKHAFNVKQMITTAYATDTLQSCYFIIDSFTQLYESLQEIDDLVGAALSERVENA